MSDESTKQKHLNLKIKHTLLAAGLHSKADALLAQIQELPDNVPELFTALDKEISSKSNEVKLKANMAICLSVARKAFSEKNIERTKEYLFKIRKYWDYTTQDEWVTGTERQYGKNNEYRKIQNEERWRKWRKEDERICANTSRTMSKLERAKIIVKNLSCSGTVDTVRKRLL